MAVYSLIARLVNLLVTLKSPNARWWAPYVSVAVLRNLVWSASRTFAAACSRSEGLPGLGYLSVVSTLFGGDSLPAWPMNASL